MSELGITGIGVGTLAGLLALLRGLVLLLVFCA